MRLTLMILLPAIVSLATLAQQPMAGDQTTAKLDAAKSLHARSGHAHNAAIRTRHRPARRNSSSKRKGAKRPAYRPEYTQNSVEVMNGASTQTVVFHDEPPVNGNIKDKSPAPMKVEVVNGTSTDTQYFSAQGTAQQKAAPLKQPVVVAIQSSDTRLVGGNKHPVVTGITAVEPFGAKNANGGGAKLTTGVAPRPKRPIYQPDAHQ